MKIKKKHRTSIFAPLFAGKEIRFQCGTVAKLEETDWPTKIERQRKDGSRFLHFRCPHCRFQGKKLIKGKP